MNTTWNEATSTKLAIVSQLGHICRKENDPVARVVIAAIFHHLLKTA